MQVLLVQNDTEASRSLEQMLVSRDFHVYRTHSGRNAISIIRDSVDEYSIVLLDTVLDDMSGLRLIRILRKMNIMKPILVVSEDSEVETKVAALNSGSDDYITLPLHSDELFARMQVAVRRSNGHAKPSITIGNLTLCLTSKSVEIRGKHLHLTPKEYSTLELLMLRTGYVISQKSFMGYLYGGVPNEPEDKIIDIYISKIRKKIKHANDGQCPIETIRGRGYTIPTDA
jgi:two-component system cell cycle response regulator CtrA